MRSFVNVGVKIVARIVEVEVMRTERGTEAFEIKVTRLEAVPPGQVPTRINPRARAGGSLKILEEARAARGMQMNWHATPKPTTLGFFRTSRKSSALRVMPMPIMMVASDAVIVEDDFENQVRVEGRRRPRMADDSTKKGKSVVKSFSILRCAGVLCEIVSSSLLDGDDCRAFRLGVCRRRLGGIAARLSKACTLRNFTTGPGNRKV